MGKVRCPLEATSRVYLCPEGSLIHTDDMTKVEHQKMFQKLRHSGAPVTRTRRPGPDCVTFGETEDGQEMELFF